jgi:6-phosphogluconolactonase (cycloisomerase 2 family)
MGGFIAPSTTIGGTVLAPGIPLSSSPMSGLYQSLDGVSVAFNAINYATLNALGVTFGNSPNSAPTLTPVINSPFVTGAMPESVAISPTGNHVYIANNGSSTISAYSLNTVTGSLTPILGSPFSSYGINPSYITVTYDGRYVLVPNSNSSSIAVFSRDLISGAIAPVTGSPFATGQVAQVNNVIASPNGLFVVATNYVANNISVYSLNPVTGYLTLVPGSPFATGQGPDGAAFSPDSKYLTIVNGVSGNVTVFAVNQLTGFMTPTLTPTYAVGAGADEAAFSPDGRHYVVTNVGANTLSMFAFDALTGILTPVIGSPFATGAGTSPHEPAFSPDGSYLVVANAGSNNVGMFSRNYVTGALTQVPGSPFAVGASPHSVKYSRDGNFVLCSNYNANTVSVLQSSVTPTFPLISALYDPLGQLGGSLSINGSLYVNGIRIVSLPFTGIASSGNFLRVDTTGQIALWGGVNTSIPTALVANAAPLAVDNSGNYLIDLSGVLTAQGVLTITHAVPANSTLFIFDNATTGAFSLITAGTLGVFNIPRGKSLWYWNGATCEYVSSGGFDSVNVTPLPAAGVAIATPHFMGVTPSWVTLEAICLTAELGYAIGDVVNVVCQATAGLALSPLSFYKNTTIVGFTLIALNQVAIMNAATGVYVIPTAANWAYRFGIDR